jgi:acid phosphatase family membrane protein YuiD
MQFFADLITNKIFIAGVLTYLITQFLKFAIYSIKTRKFQPYALLAFGGMPSSHTSVVFALLASIYISEGVSSLFVAMLFIAVVVIQDISFGRLHTQRNTQIINRLLSFIKLKQSPLKEFAAHTPLEILVGAVLGILIALVIFL